MKTDRNKNNVKSEENMILEKSRRSDANVFPVENKGKGKTLRPKFLLLLTDTKSLND